MTREDLSVERVQTMGRTIVEGAGGLEAAAAAHAHLAGYLESLLDRGSLLPEFHERLPRSLKGARPLNVLYPVGDPVFIHVRDDADGRRRYGAIEPRLSPEEATAALRVRDLMLERAPLDEIPETVEAQRQLVRALFDRSVQPPARGGLPSSLRALLAPALDPRVPLEADSRARIAYVIERDIMDAGPLEPLIRDPYIEDVHAIGHGAIFVVHRLFDLVETDVGFADRDALDLYLRTMSERIGRPVSESRPIVDATLPDGSRINIVYSTDVSRRGSSFTIRKFSETPTSITQVIEYGTLSAEIAAYLWLCLENGMSVFVCGETASGKTTTLNAMLPFISPRAKIFTAEDTPEVRPPHLAWQQLVTRETGPEEGQVKMFDLLKAALRSRPNYIIVGEIRGAEGNVAFQAMQTGHPCIATFHASSVQKMIQRFSSPPISVPISFMDNLNVCLIQMAVHARGRTLRRVLAVEEIEGYSERASGVLTRAVFRWDPVKDAHPFRGKNNSHVLENKIAHNLGLHDKREIYAELELRTRILQTLVARRVFDYHEVNAIIRRFQESGVEGLPFRVVEA